MNSNRNRTIITSRFSAPGGIETSFSYLDVHSREYSVHNSLNYRNLTVRGKSSGEAGTIRLNDHIGNRDGLRTHISRHSGRFGRDSVYGDIVATSFPKSDSHVLVDNETILWFNLIGSQNGTGQNRIEVILLPRLPSQQGNSTMLLSYSTLPPLHSLHFMLTGLRLGLPR